MPILEIKGQLHNHDLLKVTLGISNRTPGMKAPEDQKFLFYILLCHQCPEQSHFKKYLLN